MLVSREILLVFEGGGRRLVSGATGVCLWWLIGPTLTAGTCARNNCSQFLLLDILQNHCRQFL